MSRRRIAELLQDVAQHDSDKRYMSISDLQKELESDRDVDEETERAICAALLERLSVDSNNDVQTVAVRALSVLMNRAHTEQVTDICKTLCTQLLDGREELRDVYAIGIKTIVKNAPRALGAVVCTQATPLLYFGIAQDADARAKMECIEILTDILAKFGSFLDGVTFAADRAGEGAPEPARALLLRVCLAQLKPRHSASVHKRAGHCISALVATLPDDLLKSLMSELLASIAQHVGTVDEVRALVETVGGVSRMVGRRLARGGDVERIVPLLLRNMGDAADDAMLSDAANELRENCLNALESLVKQCPNEVAASIDAIVDTSLAFLVFDPNYAGAGEGESESSDSDESADSFDEFSDDAGAEEEEDGQLGAGYELVLEGGNFDMEDDTSWKVRRAAAKVIHAVAETCPGRTELLYARCTPALIARFAEREENVLVAIVHCIATMLRSATARAGAKDGAGGAENATGAGAAPALATARFEALAPAIVGAMCAELRSASAVADGDAATKKSKSTSSDSDASPPSSKAAEHMWEMSASLVELLCAEGASGALLDAQLGTLVPCLRAALELGVAGGQQRADGAPAAAALRFFRAVLNTHRAAVVHPHLALLAPLVAACVNSAWFELAAEALRVTRAMVNTLKPPRDAAAAVPAAALAPIAATLAAAIVRCLEHDAVDEAVKDEAIGCAAFLLARMCDVSAVGAHASRLIELLVGLASTGVSRTAALQALCLVASSPLGSVIGTHLVPHCAALFPTLVGFLQKSRAFKRETLAALNAIVKGYAAALQPESLQLACAAAELIGEDDLNVAGAALQLGTLLVEAAPAMPSAAVFVPSAIALANSPLLQGYALGALKRFFAARVRTQPATRAALLAEMLRPLPAGTESVVVSNLAACSAVIVLAGDRTAAAAGGVAKVSELIASLHRATNAPVNESLLLRCIGEIGRRVDISSAGLDAVVKAFWTSTTADESVKRSVAFALGNAIVGASSAMLPVLQRELVSGVHDYFALTALKELISHHGAAAGKEESNLPTLDCALYADGVMPVLLSYCQSDNDGVRSMVSECLGLMAAAQPRATLQEIITHADAAQTNTRAAIVAALKFCAIAPHQAADLDAVFAELVPDLARRLEDAELDVIHTTLLTLNVVAHQKPALLRAHYASAPAWVALYDHMRVKKELKRSVDLGPFKKKVDDGLVIRKAAFTCVHTMLTSMRGSIDVAAFIEHLCSGLGDVQDIRTQCHAIVGTMCTAFPRETLEHSDAILKCLTKTAKVKMKDGIGTEEQRRYNLIFSAVRAIDVIGALPNATSSRMYLDALIQVEGRTETKAMLQSIRIERGDMAASGGS